MSLAGRLVLLVCLALIGLGAATAAVVRARRESGATREETAVAQGESVTRELLARRDAMPREVSAAMVRGQPPPPGLTAFVATLLTPLAGASAGYCLPDGTIVVSETVRDPDDHGGPPDDRGWPPEDEDGPPGGPPDGRVEHPYGWPPGGRRGPDGHHGGPSGHRDRGAHDDGLRPLDRDVVVGACRARKGGAPDHVRYVAPIDVLFVTVAGAHEPFAAWTLVRSPKVFATPGSLAPTPLVLVIGASMLLLVGVCIETVLQMRRGVDMLASALVAAQDDLSTQIPTPRARELARVADGLRAMTAHLSGARERELTLERRLAHERRLASLGRVTAGVAHEIRNPLAGMKLRLDAMARRKLDERSARDVSRSLAEVARLDAVVTSLLLVARKEPAPLAATDLAALVDERVASLESFAAAREVRVVREGEARVSIDPVGIARAIDNLVRNAIEASPASGTVTVALHTRGADCELRVVDHGAGVPAAREGELFEPFFTSKPDGTGLGLSLARASVEAHGGTLSYQREGDATSFSIRLPGSVLA